MQAEGAIEGTAALYELLGPHRTDFAFSRFDHADLATPVSWLAASGEASSTERE